MSYFNLLINGHTSADCDQLADTLERKAAQLRMKAKRLARSEREGAIFKANLVRVRRYARGLLEADLDAKPCRFYCYSNGINYAHAQAAVERLRPLYVADWRRRRNEAMVKMKNRGRTPRQIADHFNMHPSTVRKIIATLEAA